jgi:hypothetical protein
MRLTTYACRGYGSRFGAGCPPQWQLSRRKLFKCGYIYTDRPTVPSRPHRTFPRGGLHSSPATTGTLAARYERMKFRNHEREAAMRFAEFLVR